MLELSLMPASLISRSTRSVPALPSSDYITQGNMKSCSHSPQWNCCGTCSASPLRMADTRVGLSVVPEDPREVRGIQALVQLNQVDSQLCRYVHECQLHVATQLSVGQLGKILGNKNDCGFCKDTPTPTAVEVIQLLKILPHRNPHVFGHRTRVQFEVLRQHTPPLPTSLSRVHFTWCCRCEMCKCSCSEWQSEDALREAEHVRAHTVEIALARFEHHSKKRSQDDCRVNALQCKGVVLTRGTAQLDEVRCCGNIVNIIVDSDLPL